MRNDIIITEEDLRNMATALDAIEVKETASSNTFFDVAGYPHYENVISNILGFLFKTDGEHGFRDLWINALLSCLNDEEIITEVQNSSVEREVFTLDGKRIDLLITTEEYLVCIENKIYAELYNELDRYIEYVESRNNRFKSKYGKSGSKKPIYIVLCLNRDESINKNKYVMDNTFKVVTYKELLSQIKEHLGEYITGCNEKWLLYSREMMLNLENLQEEETEMNENYIDFFAKYDKKIQKMKDECLKEFDTYVTRVNNELEARKTSEDGILSKDFTHDTYTSTKDMIKSVFMDFVISIEPKKKKTLTIEAQLGFNGWRISLYPRYGGKSLVEGTAKKMNYHCIDNDHFDKTYHYVIKEREVSETDLIAKDMLKIAKELEDKGMFDH